MNVIDYVRTHFSRSVGYELNLRDPRSFNERIQWLKLFYHDPRYPVLADKSRVKDYVRQKLGRDICVPTLAAYTDIQQFRIEDLPDSFVLKLASGSGKNFVCPDKKSLDVAATHALITRWLRPSANHYFYSYEWCYKNIPSCVIAEVMLGDGNKLVDYKFFCTHGKPEMVYATSRTDGKLNVDFFDLEWNHLPFTRQYPNAPTVPRRPEKLAEMAEIACKLAEDFAFVRVDLYCEDSQIFFGELTFYPGNGMGDFKPEKTDFDLAHLVPLPEHALLLADENQPPIKIPREALNCLLDLTDHVARPLPSPPDPELLRLADKIARMQNSLSWRATAPFRFLRRAISKKPGAAQDATR